MKDGPDQFFEKVDKARNKLLHGEDRAQIEQDLDVPWEDLSNGLGKVTWFALLDALSRQIRKESSEHPKLDLIHVRTYPHSHVVMQTNLIIGANHANPADPQIDEFMLPGLEIDMIVSERENEPGAQPGK